MPQLLIVHHTTSPNTQTMLESVLAGATTEEIENVDVVRRAALGAGPVDVLAADAILLGTPANIGYMSGALKHFFDTVYYPCLDDSRGLPFGFFVHGNSDTAGAVRGIQTITTGLGWEQVAAPVLVTGEPSRDDLSACWELGATVAAHLM
jgi:multimeric flavodoxin WrbA